MDAINMIRFDKEILSAEDYIRLRNTNAAAIKQTRIVPCTLGKKGFGGIEVTYRSPRYTAGGAL